jgi:hypothetical protein
MMVGVATAVMAASCPTGNNQLEEAAGGMVVETVTWQWQLWSSDGDGEDNDDGEDSNDGKDNEYTTIN